MCRGSGATAPPFPMVRSPIWIAGFQENQINHKYSTGNTRFSYKSLIFQKKYYDFQ